MVNIVYHFCIIAVFGFAVIVIIIANESNRGNTATKWYYNTYVQSKYEQQFWDSVTFKDHLNNTEISVAVSDKNSMYHLYDRNKHFWSYIIWKLHYSYMTFNQLFTKTICTDLFC